MIRSKALLSLALLAGTVAVATPANAQLGGLLGGSAKVDTGKAQVNLSVAAQLAPLADASGKVSEATSAAYGKVGELVGQVKSLDAAYVTDINKLKDIASAAGSKLPAADVNQIFEEAGAIHKQLNNLAGPLANADATYLLDEKIALDATASVQAKIQASTGDLKAKAESLLVSANQVKAKVDALTPKVGAGDLQFVKQYTDCNAALEKLIATASQAGATAAQVKEAAKAAAASLKATATGKLDAVQGLVAQTKSDLGGTANSLTQQLSDKVNAVASAQGGASFNLTTDVALTSNVKGTLSSLNLVDLGAVSKLTGGLPIVGGLLGGLL